MQYILSQTFSAAAAEYVLATVSSDPDAALSDFCDGDDEQYLRLGRELAKRVGLLPGCPSIGCIMLQAVNELCRAGLVDEVGLERQIPRLGTIDARLILTEAGKAHVANGINCQDIGFHFGEDGETVVVPLRCRSMPPLLSSSPAV